MYLLMLMLLSSPVDLRLPLPGRGDQPINLVPIDFVVQAGRAIADDARSTEDVQHRRRSAAQRAARLRVADPSERATGAVRKAPDEPRERALADTGTGAVRHIPRAFLEQLASEISTTRATRASFWRAPASNARTLLVTSRRHDRRREARATSAPQAQDDASRSGTSKRWLIRSIRESENSVRVAPPRRRRETRRHGNSSSNPSRTESDRSRRSVSRGRSSEDLERRPIAASRRRRSTKTCRFQRIAGKPRLKER